MDNYPGMPQITGKGLIQQLSCHCLSHDPVLIAEKVINVYPGDVFTLLTPVNTYEARTVIIATGVVPTVLFEGEKDLLGRGVSYCATCDGMFYRDKDVAVISYTPDEENEVAFLGEICRTVYFFPQYKGDFAGLAERLPRIRVLTAKPRAIRGEQQVEYVATDEENIKVEGVFIFRQSDPVENVLPGIEMEGDIIKVRHGMATNIPGVFAAGDCTGKPWQIAKAVGEGLVAALSAIAYLEETAKDAAPPSAAADRVPDQAGSK